MTKKKGKKRTPALTSKESKCARWTCPAGVKKMLGEEGEKKQPLKGRKRGGGGRKENVFVGRHVLTREVLPICKTQKRNFSGGHKTPPLCEERKGRLVTRNPKKGLSTGGAAFWSKVAFRVCHGKGRDGVLRGPKKG